MAVHLRIITAGMCIAACCCGALAQATQSKPTSAASKPAWAYSVTVGRETTYITGPLLPDGRVDYVAALNEQLSKGVTTENNAAVPILRALGPKCSSGTGGAKVLKALNLLLPEKGDYFLTPVEFADSMPATSRPSKLLKMTNWPPNQPFKAADEPEIASLLKANTKHLDAIVAATDLDHYYIPMVRMDAPNDVIDVMPISLGLLREAARQLAARALMRAGDGDYKACAADLMALHRLARLLPNRELLIDVLVAIAIDNLASGAESGIIASRLWTQEQLADYLKQLQTLPEMRLDPELFNRGERYFGLDFTGYFARCGFDAYAALHQPEGQTPPHLGHVNLDFDELLRLENRHLDELVAVLKEPSFSKRKKTFEEWQEKMYTYPELKPSATQPWMDAEDIPGFKRAERVMSLHPKATPKEVARIVFEAMQMNSDVFFRAAELAQEAAMRSGLNQAAAALEIHRVKHGRYPARLDELAPDIVKAVPQDFFTDGPLKYVPSDDGYTLYSVGPNMTDDGGKDRRFGGDDVVVRGGTAATQAASAPAAGSKW